MLGPYFYARWDQPDEIVPGMRLEWPAGGPLLAPDPALISGGWPGMPVVIWRVEDVLPGAPAHGSDIRADALTLAERVPSWRWLGSRGDELLDLLERAVATARDGAGETGWQEGLPFASGSPDFATTDPAAHAVAHFIWLLRRRLLEEAARVDPTMVRTWEGFGCDGPVSERYLSGWWAEVERRTVAAAEAFVLEPSVAKAIGSG